MISVLDETVFPMSSSTVHVYTPAWLLVILGSVRTLLVLRIVLVKSLHVCEVTGIDSLESQITDKSLLSSITITLGRVGGCSTVAHNIKERVLVSSSYL